MRFNHTFNTKQNHTLNKISKSYFEYDSYSYSQYETKIIIKNMILNRILKYELYTSIRDKNHNKNIIIKIEK